MSELSEQITARRTTQETEKIRKPFRKLGFSKLDAVEVGTRLKILLANYQMMHNKLQNFHWNVEGAEFFELHEVFEREYRRISVDIDRIAERIRVFGLKPDGTPSRIIPLSKIEEASRELRPYEMVRSVVGDYEILHGLLLDTMESSLDIGDGATEFLINQLISELERQHWMFHAYLKE